MKDYNSKILEIQIRTYAYLLNLPILERAHCILLILDKTRYQNQNKFLLYLMHPPL